jgi:hypothetical protein
VDEGTGLGSVLVMKAVCCGGPLLVMAVASGALAVADAVVVAVAVLAVASVIVLARRRRTCVVPRDVVSPTDRAAVPVRARRSDSERRRAA